MKNLLKRIGLVAVVFGLIGVKSSLVFGNLIYNIQDHASYQNGWTLSGTITTDGNLGVLTAADILSWSVTISNGSTALSFNDGGQNVGTFAGYSSFYGITATSSQLYAPIPAANGGVTGIVLGSPRTVGQPFNGPQGPTVAWTRSDFVPNSSYLEVDPQVGYDWKVNGSSLNSFDWVVATAAPVPEPSSFALLGLGGIGLMIRGYRRQMDGV